MDIWNRDFLSASVNSCSSLFTVSLLDKMAATSFSNSVEGYTVQDQWQEAAVWLTTENKFTHIDKVYSIQVQNFHFTEHFFP